MSNPYEINRTAYKYIENKVDDFTSICRPLFSFDIKVFAYFRFYDDGRYMYLCNRLDWVQFCLQNVHNNEGTSLGEEIGHVGEDGYHCFLWPTVSTDYLMEALYNHNIWHGLSIFRKREDSIELWGFAADRQNENALDFYIENIDLLKAFTTHFNENASELIVPKENKLAVYKDFKPSNMFLDDYDCSKINAFIKATPITKHPVIVDSKEVFLTNRELQCVNQLSCGKNAKQISNEFKISTRTVEKHFENIRKKIGYNNKEKIIEIYKDSINNWLL